MARHILAVVGYVVATFVTQALSHFVLFKAHYDAIPFNAETPNLPLGIATMILQGAILTWLFGGSEWRQRGIVGGVVFAWGIGAVLVSYIAIAEPAKYAVPDLWTWAAIEIAAGFVQFTLAGLALGYAHRRAP